jgi:hypothetical protein
MGKPDVASLFFHGGSGKALKIKNRFRFLPLAEEG